MTPAPSANPIVDEQLAQIADDLAAIEAERIADPLASAEDVATWTARDTDRTSRAVQLARQAEALRQHGALVADARLAAAVARYEAAVEHLRPRLKRLVTHPVVRGAVSGHNGELTLVKGWWRALDVLIAALPDGDPAARRLISKELTDWADARAALALALINQSDRGLELPQPEGNVGGAFPGGYRLTAIVDAE